MNEQSPKFEPEFLQGQRHRLMKLREELLGSTQDTRKEGVDLQSRAVGEAREFEDEAQKLAMLENEDLLVDRNRQRLADIERALQKIEDGSYGLSDLSGKPIPRERLEAVPEAVLAVSELKAR